MSNDEGCDFDKWERLNDARITALEEGDFDQALNFLDEMKKCRLLVCDSDGAQTNYIARERARTQRLSDPLNNDPTFRELLRVRTRDDIMAEWIRDCSRYDIDFYKPEIHPIPCDSWPIGEPPARRFVHYEAINEVNLNKLAELWRLQDCLLSRLRVSKNGFQPVDWDRRVAHYCRADALPGILDEGLRLCSLSSANDPSEGKKFVDFLSPFADVECVKERQETMLALQCSFSRRANDLNQFRLYGRDAVSGGEGTGLCLELNMGYFDNWGMGHVVTVESVRRQQAADESQKGQVVPDTRLPLYWVLYYNAIDKSFFYTPRQCERPFGVGPSERKRRPGIFSYRDVLRNQQAMKKLLEEIGRAFAELKDPEVLALGWDLCIYLRHLIKDAAFRDEQEMRILKLHPFDDANIQALNGKGLLSAVYCPLFERDEHSPLERIIAGPKVKNIRQLREFVEYKSSSKRILGTIAVEQSNVPLA